MHSQIVPTKPCSSESRPATAAAPALAHRAVNCPRPLRVLMVLESAGGGAGRHVLDLAEGLIQRGCEVHVIYSTGRAERRFLDRVARMPMLRHVAMRMETRIHFRDLATLRAVRRYLRVAGPFDVIHGHSSKGGAFARLAALGTGVATFYTVHGLIMMDCNLEWWRRIFYLAIERGLSLRTARIIAVSPEESRAAIQLGLGRSRLMMVPNGVAPTDLTSRAGARRELGVSDDALVVGFVGRLVDQKAVHILIQALAKAAGAVPALRLAIVGAGPLHGKLQDLAQRLGIGDKVLWLGERDAREVYTAFDLFAISSRKEGLPYVILEAMATGLPIAATVSSGVELLVESGVNGTVVPRDDDTAFANALIELASDRAKLERFGRASLEQASHFTIDAMVENTLDAYMSVTRRKMPGFSAPPLGSISRTASPTRQCRDGKARP